MEDEEPQQLNLPPPEELSLTERMYLMMRPMQRAIYWSLIGAVAVIILSGMLWDTIIEIDDFVLKGEEVHPQSIQESIEEAYFFVAAILVVGIGTIIWYAVQMRPVQKKLDALRREFTKENYFLTLGLTSHDEDVVLDIFDAMFEIFPELKQMEINSFEKTGYTLDMHPTEISDRKGGVYTFDAAEETKAGYFLIKYFSKELINIEDVEECTKIAKNKFRKRGNPNVMRLVCLAKNFDEDVLSEYKKLLKDKESPPVDLVLVTENGYSPIKISERVVDR